MWSVRRPKNHDKDEAVRPDSTRELTESRADTHGRAAELAKHDVSPEAAQVMVVGPPGCCGCVGKSASSSSRVSAKQN
jgi:hypothetical protein